MIKPDDADHYGWAEFVRHAMITGIDADSYYQQWETWKRSWRASREVMMMRLRRQGDLNALLALLGRDRAWLDREIETAMKKAKA